MSSGVESSTSRGQGVVSDIGGDHSVRRDQDSLLRLLDFRRDVVVGSPPGLVDEEQGAPATIRVIRYNAETMAELRDCSVVEAVETCPPEFVTWIDVVGVRDLRTVEALGRAFGLHPLALEDVGHLHQRTKVEDYGTFDFVVMKSINTSPTLESEQMSLFLCDRVVVTFQEHEGDHFESVRDRLRRGKGRIRSQGEDYLVYSLVDAIVDSLFPALEHFGDRLDRLERELLVKASPNLLNELHSTRQQLLALRKAVWPLSDTVSALGRESRKRISPETRVFFRDTQDHVVQVTDMIETFREVASGLVDLYLSSVSNRMNEVMSLLTIITTIFVPLSFLTGLYGMNFDSSKTGNMPELGLPYAYPVLLGMMVLLAVGLLVSFRRKGWLVWGQSNIGSSGSCGSTADRLDGNRAP